jgi:hypothetical protein
LTSLQCSWTTESQADLTLAKSTAAVSDVHPSRASPAGDGSNNLKLEVFTESYGN